MTLCAGWITGKHAFLIVDSALTVTGPRVAETIAVSMTTFGEPEVVEQGQVILEGGAKLFRLSDHVVAAFAGPTEPAYPVLNLLRYAFMEGASVPAALERVQSLIKGFALGVAGTEDGAPRLWLCVNETIKEVYKPNRVWVWGPHRSTGIPHSVQQLIGRVACDDADVFLSRAIAAVQIPLARAGTIVNGIGGACFGAAVSDAGIKTNADAAYVFYEHTRLPAMHMDRIVVSGWRSGAQFSQAFVRSTETGVFSPQTTVCFSDEDFTATRDLEVVARSLDEVFPVPRYATLVDRATSTMAFVPLDDRPDLMKVLVTRERVECRVFSDLLLWMDDLIRVSRPGGFGLMCVTKNAPKRTNGVPPRIHREPG